MQYSTKRRTISGGYSKGSIKRGRVRRDKSVHCNKSKENINNCIKFIHSSDKVNIDNDF